MKEIFFTMLLKDAYRKGDFTLSSGKKSEHYINCKPVILSAKGCIMASLLLLEEIDDDAVSVGGLTLGADPLVTGVSCASYYQNKIVDALIIRKEPKGHGTASQVEGKLPPKGSKVTVLEDVTTTGESSLKAVNVLRDLGYEVNTVVSIVDRQEGAVEGFKLHGIKLKSLYTINDFERLKEEDIILTKGGL